MTSSFRKLLEQIPKAELHVHLRGAMPPAVFRHLLEKYPPAGWIETIRPRHQEMFRSHRGIRPLLEPGEPSPAAIDGFFEYGSFREFLISFTFTGFLFREPEDLRTLVDGVARDLLAQGIVYAEITCSVPEYLRQGLSLEDILASLGGVERVRGIQVKWIADLVRDFGPEEGSSLLERLGSEGRSVITGITLGGSEHAFPPELFRSVYARARSLGFRRSIHAGEALGAGSVRTALELEAERIGHGIRAVEDPSLLEVLAGRSVPLEVCPTSNVRTGVVPGLASHPLPALLAAGVAVSLNTDDPTFFRTTLVEEYLAALSMGIGPETVRGLVACGFRHSFLPAEDVARYLEALDQSWERLAGPGS